MATCRSGQASFASNVRQTFSRTREFQRIWDRLLRRVRPPHRHARSRRPFSNDTMVYAYDALGRLSQLEFPIGAFDYTYAGQTGRRASVTKERRAVGIDYQAAW